MVRGRPKSGRSKENVIEWIESLMRKHDWSATDLARNAGISPSTILRALNQPDYPYVFSLKTLQKIAHAAGELLPVHVSDDASAVLSSDAGRRHPQYRSLEVRIVSALPAGTRSGVKTTKPEVVPAPYHLAQDDTAFAFRNPDGTLAPWFRPRALMFASQVRDPMDGDLVMLTGKDGRTRVRLLLGISESGLSLSRSMPAKEDEKVAFEEIGDIAVIVGVVTD